jgi:cyclopropane fatty-acyl-phospholipid synthase-like methyltransferase
VRWWTCPFDRVEGLVPSHGTILDHGCGHGLFSLHLALAQPARRVVGVDVDRAKIAHARRAAVAAGVEDRVEFRVVEQDLPPRTAETFDCVVAVDVLYLLGHQRALDAVRRLGDAVAPGGTLLIKEMDDRPRWKVAVNRLQEGLSVRTLGLTQGDAIELVPLDRVVDELEEAGFEVDRRHIGTGYHHPHAVVVARRPA